MTKSHEYRTNAEDCQRMAGITRNPVGKVAWLQMAEQWLRMIPKSEPTPAQ